MARSKTTAATVDMEDADFREAMERPALVAGRWYLFAAPGGFTLFGAYVRELGYGQHRFIRVRHLRNAGTVELPEMCKSGLGRNTVVTTAKWGEWNGTPIWWTLWDAETAPGGG